MLPRPPELHNHQAPGQMTLSPVALYSLQFPPDSLLDGVYSVSHNRLPNGQAFFTVQHGRLAIWAPCLTHRMTYWLQKAVRIGDC